MSIIMNSEWRMEDEDSVKSGQTGQRQMVDEQFFARMDPFHLFLPHSERTPIVGHDVILRRT